MYCRLVLGQLFLHGIGGAKYDQLTDKIIERFFGVTPPDFITLSATHYLPAGLPDVNEQDQTRLKNKRRDLHYHPEWFVDAAKSQVQDAVARKQALIDHPPVPTEKPAWHQQMEKANAHLRKFTSVCRKAVEAEEQDLDMQLKIKNVLSDLNKLKMKVMIHLNQVNHMVHLMI